MSLCLIYFNYFSGSRPTQINDFDNVHYFYTINQNKESVVEPDVKPASVMNRSTWKVLFIFMTTRWPQHGPF